VNFFKLCFVGDLNSGHSNQPVLLKLEESPEYYIFPVPLSGISSLLYVVTCHSYFLVKFWRF
jgi:hypothetical protein